MKKLSKLIGASAVLVAGVAHAAPSGLVTEWAYVNEAGFVSYTGGGVTTSTSTNTNLSTSPTYDELSWGTEIFFDGSTNGQSSLEIDTPISGTAVTNDMTGNQGTDIFHNNFIVGTENGTLETASMLDVLLLQPTAIDGAPVGGFPMLPAPEINFFVDFYETANGVDYGFGSNYPNATQQVIDTSITCPGGGQNGAVGTVNENGCGDIFVISASAPGLSFGVDPITGDLLFSTLIDLSGYPSLANYAYDVTVRLSGVEVLNDAGCAAVGEAAGCRGFVTKEREVNTLQASFTIASVFVPEPAPLALLGASLVALGWTRRKAQAK
ncbi:MAG TPA: hypothetical protein DCW59_17660 [Alteromonas sp.]|nr:hypothetical protein [Alteromonas sp.]